MLPGPIYSGKDGTRQYEIGEPVRSGSGSGRSTRYSRFGDAVKAASAYKEKKKAENEADKEDEDEKKTDTVGPKGFKIGSDSTVVTGYRDPGFTLKGVEGRSLLGPIGGALSTVFPVTGGIVSAAGSLTGL